MLDLPSAMSTGDTDAALAMLGDAIADPQAPPRTVDYMAGIAIFLACAVSRRHLILPAWLARARLAAEHSDVPATRPLARRVLASALAASDPAESRAWTRRALDVTGTLPPTSLTSPPMLNAVRRSRAKPCAVACWRVWRTWPG
jgi:hypothetical protein